MRDSTFEAYTKLVLKQRTALIEALTYNKVTLTQDQINETLILIQLNAIGDTLSTIAKKLK